MSEPIRVSHPIHNLLPTETTTVIDFAAEEFSGWFFHCHLLYHMISGMARVVHYPNFAPDPATPAVRPHLHHDPFQRFGQVDMFLQMTQGETDGWPGGRACSEPERKARAGWCPRLRGR